MDNRPSIAMMVIGTIVFVATLGAWLYAESQHIPTGALLAFAVPVVGALFLAGPLSTAARSAQQAAQQTNGVMEERMISAVGKALANRDAARTRQAQGDISAEYKPERALPEGE